MLCFPDAWTEGAAFGVWFVWLSNFEFAAVAATAAAADVSDVTFDIFLCIEQRYWIASFQIELIFFTWRRSVQFVNVLAMQ